MTMMDGLFSADTEVITETKYCNMCNNKKNIIMCNKAISRLKTVSYTKSPQRQK